MARSIARAVKFALPRGRWFGAGLLASVLQGISAVALMATSAYLISRAAEQPPVLYLMMAVVMVRGFALGRAGFRYLERIGLHEATLSRQAEIRPKLFESQIPFTGLSAEGETHAGQVARMVDDVDELQNLPTRVISPAVQSIAVAILATIASVVILPSAGFALALACLASGIIIAPLSARYSNRESTQLAATKNEFVAASHNLISNLEILQAYGWVNNARVELDKIELKLIEIQRKLAFSAGLGQSLLATASTVTVVVCGSLAGQAVVTGQLQPVILAVLVLLPLAVFDVLQSYLPVIASWQRFKASADRTLALIERELPAELSVQHGTQVIDAFDSIEFRNVQAKYPNSPLGTFAFKPASFKLSAKKSLALIGESGSGKSSIAKVLISHLALSTGEFFINGKPASWFSADSKQQTIGYQEQSTTILLGTVRDNLLIGNPSATDEQLNDALKAVGLASTFETRAGLDTWLGENAVFISGGEAQRLALARALLANFKVLILDEPTAQVHPELAKSLVIDLLRIAKNQKRAVILITHQQEFADLCEQKLSLSL